MKKILSSIPGYVIRFRPNGAVLLVIDDTTGVVVSADIAAIVEDRLSALIMVSDAEAQDATPPTPAPAASDANVDTSAQVDAPASNSVAPGGDANA